MDTPPLVGGGAGSGKVGVCVRSDSTPAPWPQPEPPPDFDPSQYPILAVHWPGLPPGADAHGAHLAELEHEPLEREPGARAA